MKNLSILKSNIKRSIRLNIHQSNLEYELGLWEFVVNVTKIMPNNLTSDTLALHGLDSRAKKIKTELKDLQSQEATEEIIQKIQTLNTEFQDVKNAYSEIKNANETAIDFTTMELSRDLTHTESRWNAEKNRFEGKEFTKPAQWFLGPFQDQNRLDVLGPSNENNEQAALGKTRQRRFTLARHIANDYVFMLSTENKSGWISRKHYAPIKADKQQAVEIGSLIYHLTGDESRLDLVQDQQALGRNAFTRKASEDSDSRVEDPVGNKVFREPRAEKFLLNGTLNMSRDAAPSEEHLLGYKRPSSSLPGRRMASCKESGGSRKKSGTFSYRPFKAA